MKLFPCNECAKVIIQSGIKEVIYVEDKYADTDEVKAAKRMFEMSGIKTTKLDVDVKDVEIIRNYDQNGMQTKRKLERLSMHISWLPKKRDML